MCSPTAIPTPYVTAAATAVMASWRSAERALERPVNTATVQPMAIALSAPTKKRWFKIVIYDGDDAPIDVEAVEGSLVEREILLRARSAGAHTLYVGDKEGAHAYYDLAEIANRRTEDLDAKPATLGPLADNPAFGKDKVAEDLPVTEKHRTAIAAVLGVVLLGLAAWAVRLIRAR